MSLRTIFTEPEIDILFAALKLYSNRAKTNGSRNIQGYGKSTEYEKREKWMQKHDEAEQLLSKISNEAI
jgi:hypothetical protein